MAIKLVTCNCGSLVAVEGCAAGSYVPGWRAAWEEGRGGWHSSRGRRGELDTAGQVAVAGSLTRDLGTAAMAAGLQIGRELRVDKEQRKIPTDRWLLERRRKVNLRLWLATVKVTVMRFVFGILRRSS